MNTLANTAKPVAMTAAPSRALVLSSEYEGKLNAVLQKMAFVAALKENLLEQGTDYDTIPGTQKPTLLQPGAQKLLLAFGLRADVDDLLETWQDDPGEGHLEVRVKVAVRTVDSDRLVATCIASCSTRETRYAFRKGEPIPTGRPVPPQYWDYAKGDARKGIAANLDKAAELLGGKGFRAAKVDGLWQIVQLSDETVENENLADTYNTVRKMAQKRGIVGGAIQATGTSQFFTQDLEDLAANTIASNERVRAASPVEAPATPASAPSPAARPAQPAPAPAARPAKATDLGGVQRASMLKEMEGVFRAHHVLRPQLEAWLGSGRALETVTDEEIELLRNIDADLSSGMVSWEDVMDARRRAWESAAEAKADSLGDPNA